MGGDESNSSPPSDTAPGGGTFPIDASGNAYNPAWGNQMSFTDRMLSGIGSGLGTFGKGMQNQSVPNLMTGTQFAPPYIPSSESQMDPALIPAPGGGAQKDLLEALKRLLSGGGSG